VSLPLANRRILVTRRPEQSATLVTMLEALGAVVLELPTIEISPADDTTPLDSALLTLHRFDWVVFTSPNAVSAVKARMEALGTDNSVVGRATSVASVGPSTTEAIHERFPGSEVALQPEAGFRAEGLIEAFRARGVRGQRILLPSSSRARPALAQALISDGARVEVVTAYRTVTPPGLQHRFQEILLAGFDLATFASPSAIENLAEIVGERIRGVRSAVIGPVTEEAARAAGLDVRVVANPSTAAGLVEAIVAYFESEPGEVPEVLDSQS
jgi:uroporphyrinogen III methyltransferase/synthase